MKTYTVKEVAEALGFSTNTVYKYLDEEKIKATRLGKEGRFRIPEEEFVRLLGAQGKKLEETSPQQLQTPQLQTPPQSKELIEEAENLIKKIHTPSIFDWFVALLSIFVGLSYFLFPLYTQLRSFDSYLVLFSFLRGILIFLGVGLIASDILGYREKVYHLGLHFLIGALFLFAGLILLETGNIMQSVGNFAIAILLLLTSFLKLDELKKFTFFLLFLAVVAGIMFVLNPELFPSRTLSFLISENRILFGLFWASLFGLVVWMLVLKKIRESSFGLLPYIILAAGALFYAALSIKNGFWESGVYSLVLGSFALILPFRYKFDSFSKFSKKELLEAFAWFVTVLVIGVGLVFYLQQSFKSYVAQESQKSLKLGIKIVESYIEESRRAIVSFSQDEDLIATFSVTKMDIDKLDQLGRKFYLNSTTFRRVIFIDEEGKGVTVYPADESFKGVDLSERNYFRQAKTNKRIAISEVIKPVIPGVPAAIVIAAPILDQNENFRGVVGGSVDFVKLTSKMNEIKFGSDGIFVIADSSRKIILHPDEKMLLESVEANEALLLAVDGKSGQIEGFSNKGKLQLQSFAPIEFLGWGIVAQQPLAEVLRQSSTTAFMIFLVTILSGIGSLLAVLYIRKR